MAEDLVKTLRAPTTFACIQPTHWHSADYAKGRKLLNDVADRIEVLEAENTRLRENMRQNYDAFTAMRNDINEIIGNMVSQDEGVLRQGAGMSFECEAVVDAVRAGVNRMAAATRAQALSDAMAVVEGLRVAGAANFKDARFAGQRGADHADALYDAHQAIKKLLEGTPR